MSITDDPGLPGEHQQLMTQQAQQAQLTELTKPTEPKAGRQFALRAGAAVVAAAVVGVGIGIGILRTQYPERSVVAAPVGQPSALPSASASPSPSFGTRENGSHFGSLRDLLLPLPDDHRVGPDAGAYGNDTELTEEQRKGWVEDQIRDLPEKLRDRLRQDWQETPLTGAGVRSYVAADRSYVVTIWLLRYHQEAVKADTAWQNVLGSDSGLYRLGPNVAGHDQARCFLPSAEPGAEIDHLICSAAEGDLRVEMEVEGVAPLPKEKTVDLFSRQLDRLARPGASA
ncbi:hypothetical protein ACIRBX_07055 [Kitasatospora sp. NPDC096147]|uniref:hypothetical protein n=1 Tax=Kitasatospora sp. NPDC096147 TaxID=3364093 RepID=UPI00381D9138